MRFYTKEESENWATYFDLPSARWTLPTVTVWYPQNPAELDFAWIAGSFREQERILLWITEWGIWPSSENWHLYYKLRQSYGDHRLLHEAPGHLFLDYERADLASFLQLAVGNGWGGYILASTLDTRVFFSHDEYMDFFATEDSKLDIVRERYSDLLSPPGSFHAGSGKRRIAQDGTELSPAEVHPGPDRE